jgi:pyridinium-3,5-bisthiocarboxylic acid mononucleotide nickel chelatase
MGERVLYYDCFAGISGDMNLGALVDAGVPPEHVIGELARLNLHGYTLRFSRGTRNGIQGTRADVVLSQDRPHDHHHEHRSYADIVLLIEASPLDARVKKRALAIFAVLAAAEAKVHGRPLEDVRFHEVGAVDSIVDIVGTAICLEHLRPDSIECGTVELGSGFITCAHGRLPVPAPATAELLTGVPVRSGAAPFEMTTPTGAAVLKANVDCFGQAMDFIVKRVAYGIGHKDAEVPNLLRVFFGERPAAGEESEAALLECNIDDMSPELYGHVSDLLFAAGAADVTFTPIVMKKTRPAVMLSVLCAVEAVQRLSDLLLLETSTFGIRRTSVRKTALVRETRAVLTSLGEVRVKTAFMNGKSVKKKLEYEDCRRIAEEKSLPLRAVFDALLREIG